MALDDDRCTHVIPFLSESLEHLRRKGHDAPLFVGLNGIQGAGKTTLVSTLKKQLTAPPYNLNLAVLSLDDFYLLHADQVALAASQPTNPLVQYRGEPSTHDIPLLRATLDSLLAGRPTLLPCYDKSLHAGAGDRSHESTWVSAEPPIDILILEGWCTGFMPLADEQLEAKWRAARERCEDGEVDGQLGRMAFQHVRFINEALRRYEEVWRRFDAMVYIDAEDLKWVYDWRLEAEREMRKQRGTGMTDEQVKNFVDGYYPAYELYTDMLRTGTPSTAGGQLRLVVGRDRKVINVSRI